MSVNLIFKIAAVGILVSVLGQVLKHSGRDEQAFMVSLAGLLIAHFSQALQDCSWFYSGSFLIFQICLTISDGSLLCKGGKR